MFFKDEKEYKNYLEKNGVKKEIDGKANFFNMTENGEVILENSKSCKSELDITNYTNCLGWILLSDKKTMGLLKLPFGDVYRNLTKEQYDLAIYNNILLPQIAKQFHNDSALYYIAKQDKKKSTYNENRKFILTLDFKEKDEELIYGEKMLEKMQYDINELRIEQLLFAIEDYLIEIGARNQDIENIRKNFIKQTIYNRFVKQADENNHNWGILINKDTRRARIAPLYDLDCCCDIGPLKKHKRIDKEGGTTQFESIINQFKNEEWFNIFIQETINEFDINKAIKDSKKQTNITLPENIQKIYKEFFGQRFYELKNSYEKVSKNIEEDRER